MIKKGGFALVQRPVERIIYAAKFQSPLEADEAFTPRVGEFAVVDLPIGLKIRCLTILEGFKAKIDGLRPVVFGVFKIVETEGGYEAKEFARKYDGWVFIVSTETQAEILTDFGGS